MDYISQDPLHSGFLLGLANGKHPRGDLGPEKREVEVFALLPFLPHYDWNRAYVLLLKVTPVRLAPLLQQ